MMDHEETSCRISSTIRQQIENPGMFIQLQEEKLTLLIFKVATDRHDCVRKGENYLMVNDIIRDWNFGSCKMYSTDSRGVANFLGQQDYHFQADRARVVGRLPAEGAIFFSTFTIFTGSRSNSESLSLDTTATTVCDVASVVVADSASSSIALLGSWLLTVELCEPVIETCRLVRGRTGIEASFLFFPTVFFWVVFFEAVSSALAARVLGLERTGSKFAW